ncbi:unnamed protein product [Larinioides sclopetarius]|uniref:Secreted protein n=1 Tax=Larinioides sclopetarius TaxID=280406 RepID=A0AAV2B2G8_9ARAC
MKRPFATSLLFILMAYVERFESRMDDDELYQCFVKLVCQMDKGEEFYNMVRDSGPKNAEKCLDIFRQVGDIEVPEFTLESIMQLKEIPCKWPEERRKKTFFDWSKLYGEHLLDICQQADSELCIKADIAAVSRNPSLKH